MAEFDWENLVTLESIERVEVYSAANVPFQFRPSGSSCGSVLSWTTKDRYAPPPHARYRRTCCVTQSAIASK